MKNNLQELLYKLKDEMGVCQLLDDKEIKTVAPCFDLVEYPAGSIIFSEGDIGNFMGFIISGKLEVKKQTEFKGKQIILALLGKGSFVGELSTFDKYTRSATVIALEDSKIIILRRETLETLLQDYPQTAIKMLQGIIQILSIRLRKSTERLAAIF
jgi:CRP-like cAMP-binding protein